MSAALRERLGYVRWGRTMNAIENMTEGNWRETLASFDEVTATMGAEFSPERIHALIRAGFVGARGAIEELVEKDLARGSGFGTSSQAFEGWAARDPAAAWEWMRQSADESLRRACLPRYAWGVSAADPEKQFDYFKQLSDAEKSVVAADTARALIQTAGFSAADQLLAGEIASGAEGGNNNALRTIFDVIARQRRHAVESGGDADAACTWLAGYAEKPFVSPDQYRQMASQLTKGHGPESAVNWLASIYSANTARVTQPALAATMQDWAVKDPNAAGEWLRGQRQHTGYASMVTAFVAAVENQDPDAAAAWRKTIE